MKTLLRALLLALSISLVYFSGVFSNYYPGYHLIPGIIGAILIGINYKPLI